MEPNINNPVNVTPQQVQPQQTQQGPPPNHKKWLPVLLVSLFVILAATSAYAWHKQVNDLNKQVRILKTQNYQLRYELTDLRNR